MRSACSALVLIGKHVFVQFFKFTASGEEELEGGVLRVTRVLLLFFTHSVNLQFKPIICQALRLTPLLQAPELPAKYHLQIQTGWEWQHSEVNTSPGNRTKIWSPVSDLGCLQTLLQVASPL